MSHPESPETRQKIPVSPNVKVLEKFTPGSYTRVLPNQVMDLSDLSEFHFFLERSSDVHNGPLNPHPLNLSIKFDDFQKNIFRCSSKISYNIFFKVRKTIENHANTSDRY